VLAQNPNLHGVRPYLALCLSQQSRHEAALAELNEDVKRTASVDADIAYAVASAYALEGERDEAFEWLKRSVALGNENQPWFERDPIWAGIREDVRFAQMIRKISRTAN